MLTGVLGRGGQALRYDIGRDTNIWSYGDKKGSPFALSTVHVCNLGSQDYTHTKIYDAITNLSFVPFRGGNRRELPVCQAVWIFIEAVGCSCRGNAAASCQLTIFITVCFHYEACFFSLVTLPFNKDGTMLSLILYGDVLGIIPLIPDYL
uniref:Uncharacterized protein n=1 Tax=Oryza rufipogon TaxID=4529 RepID=A0A0E0PMA2_ORYRU